MPFETHILWMIILNIQQLAGPMMSLPRQTPYVQKPCPGGRKDCFSLSHEGLVTQKGASMWKKLDHQSGPGVYDYYKDRSFKYHRLETFLLALDIYGWLFGYFRHMVISLPSTLQFVRPVEGRWCTTHTECWEVFTSLKMYILSTSTLRTPASPLRQIILSICAGIK